LKKIILYPKLYFFIKAAKLMKY